MNKQNFHYFQFNEDDKTKSTDYHGKSTNSKHKFELMLRICGFFMTIVQSRGEHFSAAIERKHLI